MFNYSSISFFSALNFLIKPVSLLCLTFWLSACQTPPLHVYSVMKEGVDLSQYKTFTIPVVSTSESRYFDYINAGIIKTLSEKGYQLSQPADLIVQYSLELIADEVIKVESIPEQGNIHNQASMEAIFEASMLVNIIDTKTKKVIWKAATTRDLKNINMKKVDQERVNRSMEELFESFPKR